MNNRNTTAKLFCYFQDTPKEVIENIARNLAYCPDLANLRLTSKLMNIIVENTQSGKLARHAINSQPTTVDSFFANIASDVSDFFARNTLHILGTGNIPQISDLKKGKRSIENLVEKQKTIKEILSEPENSPLFLR